jgi:aminoglycoside phosphotransferase (APT) family kinase protein
MTATEPLVASPVLAGDPTRIERVDQLARRVAAHLDLPEPRLERTSMNAVYRAGPCAIRICRPTTDPVVALNVSRALTDLGLAVPVPYDLRSFVEPDIDPELWATTWEHIDHDPSAQPDWAMVGRMARELHGVDPSRMSAIHPLPVAGGFSWWDVVATLDDLAASLAPARLSVLRSAHERLQWVLPHLRESLDDAVVVHGDLHPGNVVVERRSGRTVVLDWDLLALSRPEWDHAPLLRWEERWGGRPGTYSEFALGYGGDLTDDVLARGIAELRLLVATVMRVRASITDPTAVNEAEKRVGYWAGSDARPWIAA